MTGDLDQRAAQPAERESGATLGATPGAPAPVAISVRDVTKRYRIYRRQSDRLAEWLTRRPRHRPFWALQGVSFAVQRGEIVGIVGRNGAGKTTLLRLLTGISAPTSGEIDVNYRMSAILELGSGFHPDFTGRDNVFLGGAVLGMDEAEIARKYDEIVAFSELGAYMDMPFKTYSLGMQARLSFSVAISVEPEILIIDEALAAGDASFIARCFERIRQICASGATVLFVSHNTYLVQRLTQRALWIDGGRLVGDGHPATVCRDYEAALRAHDDTQAALRAASERSRFKDAGQALASDQVSETSASGRRGAAREGSAIGGRGVVDAAGATGGSSVAGDGRQTSGGAGTGASDAAGDTPAPAAASSRYVWGTGEVSLTSVEILNAAGEPVRFAYSGEPLTVRLRYDGNAPYDDLAVVVLFTRADGVAACTLDVREAGVRVPPLHGQGVFEVTLDPLLLGRGRYFLSPHIYRDRQGIASGDDVLVYHDRTYELLVERRGRPYDVALEQPARWRHLPDQ